MFLDLPPDRPTQSPVVMVAEAHQARNPVGVQRTLGICKPIENIQDDEYLGKVVMTFPGDARNYLFNYEKQDVDWRDAKVMLLQPPINGKLEDQGNGFYTYRPNLGFHGQDKISALVELGGYQIKVVYFIKVVNEDQRVGDDEASIRKYCGSKGNMWKISLPTTPVDPSTLQYLLDQTGLNSSAVNLQVADLPGSSLGQTTNTSITLDTHAAGYNWFIDSTPFDNSEFLPTANPNEWIAKADSEAAGKMDMLSVLLHEYGHALGIGHSAHAGDYMATTLQPGVRRLPSAAELELMAQLAGEIKNDLADAGSNTPLSPQSPLPSLPLGGAFGVALLGRLRGTRYSGWTNSIDSVTQYAVAANPKLSNPDFAGTSADQATGWSTTGKVRFQDGAATLTETAESQTRLNQVFIVGETDRFLSFTVANAALDDATNAPDDAFEVALLDANTGASLLGGTGLSRNDAILNLQADGSESKAQAVTRIDNADGSHTYLVDLAGIAAGTAVNLSFDLIGFEATAGKGAAAVSSQLTIRDLRIGVPQAKDDSATLAEDSTIAIAALANDLNAQQPGFVPVIVDAPAHGQVTINADGSFSFTPDQDWNGDDQFTYKLSDGHVDSNLATVSLTVTPVNDAPVAVADIASVGEDGDVDAPKEVPLGDTGTALI